MAFGATHALSAITGLRELLSPTIIVVLPSVAEWIQDTRLGWVMLGKRSSSMTIVIVIVVLTVIATLGIDRP
ncbi:hypothetical protein GCM10007304_16890 [Rhodococcoides trifolii]|uniref:Uncharacterized protein n=1 Tax=Rhodococcoides trifolii TaxID=908250 RepID=A0A917CZE8_9NOCA|nr:hypothetical protein GCM10007304_16890 [Rhodococcus trifolii]